MKIIKWILPVVFSFLLFVGAMLALGIVVRNAINNQFYRNAQGVGIIVELDTTRNIQGGSTKFGAKINYLEKYHIRQEVDSSGLDSMIQNPFYLGDTVLVNYNPEKPEEAYIQSEKYYEHLFFKLLVFGCFPVIFFFGLRRAILKKNQKTSSESRR